MRKQKDVETTLGVYTLKELTPTHIAEIKESGSKVLESLRAESDRTIKLRSTLDQLTAEKNPKAKTSDIATAQADLSASIVKDEAHSNVKMMTDAPEIIEQLSGDSIICSNVKAKLSDLPFSELAEMWAAFKEVNASFLAMVPLDRYAERVLLNLKSELLPQPLSDDET